MAAVDVVRLMQTSRSTNSAKKTASASDSLTAFSSMMKQSSQKAGETSADSRKSELKVDADAKNSNSESAKQTEQSEMTGQTEQLDNSGKLEQSEKTELSDKKPKTEEQKEAAELAAMLQAQLLQAEQLETGFSAEEALRSSAELDLTEAVTGAAEVSVTEAVTELFLEASEQTGAFESLNVQELADEVTVFEQTGKVEQNPVIEEDASPEVQRSETPFSISAEENEPTEGKKTAGLQDDSEQEHDADLSEDAETGFETVTAEHQVISQYSHQNELNAEQPILSEHTTTVRTTPETFGTDIGASLANKLPSTDGTLTIELEPATLGKLTLKVMYEGDKATVSILTSNPKTLELLSQSAEEIAQILKERTGQETMIYTPQTEQQQDWTQGGNQEHQQRQQEQQQKQRQHTESFAQQLRLGLI